MAEGLYGGKYAIIQEPGTPSWSRESFYKEKKSKEKYEETKTSMKEELPHGDSSTSSSKEDKNPFEYIPQYPYGPLSSTESPQDTIIIFPSNSMDSVIPQPQKGKKKIQDEICRQFALFEKTKELENAQKKSQEAESHIINSSGSNDSDMVPKISALNQNAFCDMKNETNGLQNNQEELLTDDSKDLFDDLLFPQDNPKRESKLPKINTFVMVKKDKILPGTKKSLVCKKNNSSFILENCCFHFLHENGFLEEKQYNLFLLKDGRLSLEKKCQEHPFLKNFLNINNDISKKISLFFMKETSINKETMDLLILNINDLEKNLEFPKNTLFILKNFTRKFLENISQDFVKYAKESRDIFGEKNNKKSKKIYKYQTFVIYDLIKDFRFLYEFSKEAPIFQTNFSGIFFQCFMDKKILHPEQSFFPAQEEFLMRLFQDSLR